MIPFIQINPGYSLEGLMMKLKLQYFGHLMQRADFIAKDPDAGKDWRQERGTTEDEMVGWHHRLDGHEFEQTLGDGEGQGSLACCSQWDRKDSDTTEWLNNNNSYHMSSKGKFWKLPGATANRLGWTTGIGNGNVLKQDCGDQITKNHWNVHLSWTL